MRDLEHDAATDQATLEGERPGQHLPAAIDLTDDIFKGDADIVIEDVGEGTVIHRGCRPDRDALGIHRHDEHADPSMRWPGILIGARGEEHVLSPPRGGPYLLAVDDPRVAVTDSAGA